MYTCTHCDKEIKTKRGFIKHEESCGQKQKTHEEQLKCTICNKEFSRLDSRKRHDQMKSHIEAANAQQSLLANGDHNNNTINNTTNNNYNITIKIPENLKAFGQEELRHLLRSEGFILKCIRQQLPGLLDLIKARNFYDKKKQNKNIQKDNKRDQFIRVFNGKDWEFKMKDEALEALMRNTTYLTDQVIDKYLGADESDDTFKPLDGNERDIFIRSIQGYLSIMKIMGFPIDETTYYSEPPKDLSKEKILNILDEFVYNHSERNQTLQMANKITALENEVNMLKAQIAALAKST